MDITVALPTWRSQHIIWLALEGLSRQEDAPPWELIVHACDRFETQCIVEDWRDRLARVNCRQINVITNTGPKLPLGEKWRRIANVGTGECYVLCASDNFSPPNRLRLSHKAIVEDGYDWADCSQGLFYDINSGDRATWVRPKASDPGLWMCTRREYMRRLEGDGPKAGVDGWIRSQLPEGYSWKQWDGPLDGVHTDGCNTISHKRVSAYRNSNRFIDPTQKPNKILPNPVWSRLKEMGWRP